MADKEPKKPYPVINKDKCTGCGVCVSICPFEVFSMENGKAVVKHPSKCIGCRACESQCPEEAIKVID